MPAWGHTARSQRSRLTFILLAALGAAVGGLQVQAGDLPAGAAQWPPVMGRPALTEAEIARFLKANAVAEHKRQRAQERFIAALPAVRHTDETKHSLWGGIDFVAALGELERLTAGIEKDACKQAGVSYDEYRSVFTRILQVNELVELQLRVDGKRESIARLTREDLRELAQEQLRFQRQLERNEVHGHLRVLERRLATLARQRAQGQDRERRRITGRLQRIPQQEGEVHQRLAQFRRFLEREREVLDAHARDLQRRRDAEAAGWIEETAPEQQLRDARFRTQVETKSSRLQAKIGEWEQRLVRLAAQRQELEVALAALAAEEDLAEPTQEELDIEQQLVPFRQQIEELDDRIERGGTDRELAPLITNLRDRLESERKELSRREQGFGTPTMLQARRDYEVVTRHAASLTTFGSPIVLQPLPDDNQR